jgi:hypothetical protein
MANYERLITGRLLQESRTMENQARFLYASTAKFMNLIRKVNAQEMGELATLQKMSRAEREKRIRQRFAELKSGLGLIGEMSKHIRAIVTIQNRIYSEARQVAKATAKELGIESAYRARGERFATPQLAKTLKQI